MRVIKFRAWSHDGDQISPEYIGRDGLGYWKEDSIPTSGPVEQFTGLLDKNGVEIYENDLCLAISTNVVGYIVFHNGRFAWTDGACHWDIIENSRADHCPVDSIIANAEDLQVIGNIHQNQELLK